MIGAPSRFRLIRKSCCCRGLGYMLFIAHLCNHILLQSGGGTWDTALQPVSYVI